MTDKFTVGSITFSGMDRASGPDASFVSIGNRNGIVNFDCGKHAAAMSLASCPYCEAERLAARLAEAERDRAQYHGKAAALLIRAERAEARLAEVTALLDEAEGSSEWWEKADAWLKRGTDSAAEAPSRVVTAFCDHGIAPGYRCKACDETL